MKIGQFGVSRILRVGVLLCVVIGFALDRTAQPGVLKSVGQALMIIGAVGLVSSSFAILYRNTNPKDAAPPPLRIFNIRSITSKISIGALLISLTSLIGFAAYGYRGRYFDQIMTAILSCILISSIVVAVIACTNFAKWHRDTSRLGGFRRPKM
jgi:hypothetical protein